MDPDDQNSLRSLWPSLANIWKRDRDPFLNQLRWRLHLRLLLISAALSAGFFVRGLLLQGSLDLGLGLGATLLAWLFLRRFPAYNRWVVRLNLTLFVSLGIHGLWQRPGPAYPIELLALMIMPVFGTLLDGVSTGAVVLAAGLAATGLWLQRSGLRDSADSLAVLFSLLGSSALYFCCVAHTWIFTSLVEEQRSSKEAVQATRQAVERLAATLSDQVFTQTQRLRTDLTAQGLSGLAAAQDLQATLAQARSKRPLEIPRNPVIAVQAAAGPAPLSLVRLFRHSLAALRPKPGGDAGHPSARMAAGGRHDRFLCAALSGQPPQPFLAGPTAALRRRGPLDLRRRRPALFQHAPGGLAGLHPRHHLLRRHAGRPGARQRRRRRPPWPWSPWAGPTASRAGPTAPCSAPSA